jgi:uncharacterized protein with ParB-like and HNH nuclease domain
MKITPSPLTISQLFSSNNEQFFVPAYQRRYAWSEKQLGELFDDVNLLKENETHLLSTIVFLTETHTAGINQLEVVDGQQRITSISILLKTLHDKFIDAEQEDTAKEIKTFLVCKGIDRKERNKLLLGELDNSDYVKLIEDTDLDEIINQNLVNAYDYFSDWLDEYCRDLNLFYYKLINNIMVIRLDVGHAKDAYKLFETINNRGLKLSPTDIIKNFLLGNASIINESTLTQVRNYWQDVIINLDQIKTDDFFRQLFSGILTRKVPISKLIDEFKEYYIKNVKEGELLSTYHIYKDTQAIEEDEPDDINESDENSDNPKLTQKISLIEFTGKLKLASSVYEKIINQNFDNEKINQCLYNLERIKSFPSYIFLLNLFQRSLPDKTFINILKMLETFMLRRHICEYRTGELDDIFSKIVNLDDNNIEQEVAEFLKKHLPTDGEFEEKLALYSFKGNIDRAKYMLECFEYNAIEDKGEYQIKGGEDVHLEHIIPQVINTLRAKREFGDWVSYLGEKALDKHGIYVDRIGNYTLIASKLNIAASNNPFLAKKNEYKKSNLSLSKFLASNYRDFKFKQVDERSKRFAKLAVEIWNI